MSMIWKFEKFKGDKALYAFCPECGYHYIAGVEDQITKYYTHCLVCGKYLYEELEEYTLAWNERFIFDEDVMEDLYGKE